MLIFYDVMNIIEGLGMILENYSLLIYALSFSSIGWCEDGSMECGVTLFMCHRRYF